MTLSILLNLSEPWYLPLFKRIYRLSALTGCCESLERQRKLETSGKCPEPALVKDDHGYTFYPLCLLGRLLRLLSGYSLSAGMLGTFKRELAGACLHQHSLTGFWGLGRLDGSRILSWFCHWEIGRGKISYLELFLWVCTQLEMRKATQISQHPENVCPGWQEEKQRKQTCNTSQRTLSPGRWSHWEVEGLRILTRTSFLRKVRY